MSQSHLIPKGLKNWDVEWGRPRQPPPLSFIPKKRDEVTRTLTTVKVKISDSLTETVTAFAGTDPEAYIELMDQFTD